MEANFFLMLKLLPCHTHLKLSPISSAPASMSHPSHLSSQSFITKLKIADMASQDPPQNVGERKTLTSPS